MSAQTLDRRALLAGALAAGAVGFAENRPPNILLIVSDDHGWTDYGFMGHRRIDTPNLDRLAARSLRFTRGYVPSSLCAPSLGSLISGLYPWQTGVCSNDPPGQALLPGAPPRRDPEFTRQATEMAHMLDNVPTLPRELRRAGYLSMQTGKWWQGGFRAAGFTHGMTVRERAEGGRHGGEGLSIGRSGLQPIADFLDQTGGRPWFCWYAPMLPHTPHTAPHRLLDKYRARCDSLHTARYFAMVEWFDETVGELLDLIQKRGEEERTIVAYVADNGWIQRPDAEAPSPDSKCSQYDGGLRTPILLSWPERARPSETDRPVSSLDLMPTLLRAAGLEPPAGLPGTNLFDPAAVNGRDAIFGCCFTHSAVDIHDPVSSLEYRWCIAEPLKLILPNPANVKAERKPSRGIGPELYNLRADPFESRNLAAERPDDVAALTRRIDDWWPAAAGRV